MKYCERDILKLLAKKHTKDIFVHHCKNGPTWGVRGLLILDAWVMKKSWYSPRVTGYEIKISRADFLSDKKWPAYLEYCNVFYFVCPPGVIKKTDLPKDVGLYYTSINTKVLYIQQRSKYREIESFDSIYKYVLICRSTINPSEKM